MDFDELVFIRALMDRPADARRYSEMFKPEWLRTAEYQPILAEIFEFISKFGMPPQFTSLRERFVDNDKAAYEMRYKDTIDKLEALTPDDDHILMTLDKAKKVAVAWSFTYIMNNPDFQHSLENFETEEVFETVHKWMTKFDGSNEDLESNISDAVEALIKTRGWNTKDERIPTEIDFIDEWCGGGLKKRQLGIAVAPTGAGKSLFLANLAYGMSVMGGHRVLLISNELTMNECVERLGSLLAQTTQDEVSVAPTKIRDGLNKLTKFGVRENLRLVEVNREISANDIEGMISRNVNLYGWTPDVVIIDYMERMKPLATGMSRENTSGWFGEVAKDLIRMSKRLHCLVWTAAQTNRSGMNTEVEQSMTQAQGSIKHFQEASAVIGIRQRKDLTKQLPSLLNTDIRILEFASLKMRHAKGAESSKFVEVDMGKMTITKNYHAISEWDKFDEDEEGMETQTGKKNKRGRKHE